MALFQQSSSGSTKNLVEFKCGKMTMSGTTVTADPRKGLLYIQKGEDQAMHLYWKDRTSGKVEDDVYLFPDDAEFVPVPQCKDGRVYLLKFKSHSNKRFFWMQEPDKNKDKDKDLIEQANEAINNPQAADAGLMGSGHEELLRLISSSGGIPNAQLQNLIQSQMRSGSSRSSRSGNASKKAKTDDKGSKTSSSLPTPNFSTVPATGSSAGASSAATPTPGATPGGASTPGAAQLSDLQSILTRLGGAASPSAAAPIDIAEAMRSEDLIPMLADEKIREALMKHLPEGNTIPKTEAELKETIHSPQFKQATQAFSHALSTGQLGPVLKQFGISDAACEAATKGDVAGFAKAMQEDAKKNADKPAAEDSMETN
ncbi:Oidioi.mRNA.OKI2018_I69.chr2.g4361.t1.cds [Oikopleura dioica]|uniref:Oidioi.mRNA.OKI2018_I69.chr2.g4361.t1.cds n=1 Tax=Oikopleura dioica TaxID=34765 RepID=A0ABN7SWP7_OIKDI|nr:Oidioi.mRNA.OKI2018_I69.chr2.g4361.t1.cds [Oikopleura dioica]